MKSLLLHEWILFRRFLQEHLGDIKSRLSLIGMLILGLAIAVKNLPKLQSASSGISQLWFFTMLLPVPLGLTVLLHWRGRVLLRGSLVGDAILNPVNRWLIWICAPAIGSFLALGLLAAVLGPRMRTGGIATATMAYSLWFVAALTLAVILELLARRSSASPRSGASSRRPPVFPPGQLPLSQAALEGVAAQQAFVPSLGRLAPALWALPIVGLAVAGLARMIAPNLAKDLAGAALILSFIMVLVIGRVDYRTVRFLRQIGFGRRGTIKLHLLVPFLYAAILLALGGLVLIQPLQGLVGLGAAITLVTISTALRVLCYREMGRAEAEFDIQKWLWICAIAGVIFLPAAIVAAVLWGRHLLKIGTDHPRD